MRARVLIHYLGFESCGAAPVLYRRGRPLVRALVWGEVQTDDQSADVQLLIWTLACVVLVFVVGLDLQVPVKFAQRQQATDVKTCGTPLGILALVEELGASIRTGVVIVNRDAALGRDSVAVARGELVIGPVEVAAVPVCDEDAPRHWNMKHDQGFDAICERSGGRRKVAIPDREDDRHGLHVVHVEDGHFSKFFTGPRVEFKAWPQLRAREVAFRHVTLRLKSKPDIGR